MGMIVTCSMPGAPRSVRRLQPRCDLAHKFDDWDVYQTAVLGRAVVPNPGDASIVVDEHEGMPWLATRRGPCEYVLGTRDPRVGVRQQRHGDPVRSAHR